MSSSYLVYLRHQLSIVNIFFVFLNYFLFFGSMKMNNCRVTVIDELWDKEELNTVGFSFSNILLILFSELIILYYLYTFFCFYKNRIKMHTMNKNEHYKDKILNYMIV